jgi:ribA/ribD-fused uncharacterized protein
VTILQRFKLSTEVSYGPTAEHFYQAAHFFESDPNLVEQILRAPSAHAAQQLVKTNAHLAPESWDDMKVDLMYEICKMKLEQHEYVQRKLLQTGDLPIVEGSPKDTFWGWGHTKTAAMSLVEFGCAYAVNLDRVLLALIRLKVSAFL